MRILVVGGSGEMGSAAAYDLTKSQGVKEVVIASRRSRKENLHPKLASSEMVKVKNLDVRNEESLVEGLKGFDAVINCVGPFYSTGYLVARGAIAAGVNYVDIADDYDAVERMLDTELHRDAEKAGITLLYGMGADPGTANILAKMGADKMDVVEEIEFFWVLGASDCKGKAVWEHVLHMNTGLIPQYIDGALTKVPAGTECQVVDFIEPFGPCEVHFVGHPEPLTIPRYIQGVKRVVNKGGLLPRWVNDEVRALSSWGFTSTEPIEVEGKGVNPRELALELWQNRPPNRDLGDYTSGVKTVVKGFRGGEPVIITYDIGGNTAPGTGIPASIGAQMIARGDVPKKGVHAPEGCIDPQLFLKEFVKRKAVIFEKEYSSHTIQKG